MSFPCDSQSVPFVNHGINPDDFPTVWGTFNATSSVILSLPAGCITATFNISVAYRLTPIQPDQQHHLCILWDRLIYINHTVMFRLSSSTGVYGCMADMLVAIYKAAGFRPLLKWANNFLAVHLPHQSWMEHEFMDLTGFHQSTLELHEDAAVLHNSMLHWIQLESSLLHSGPPPQQIVPNSQAAQPLDLARHHILVM